MFMKGVNRCSVRSLRKFSSAGKETRSKIEHVPSLKNFIKAETEQEMDSGLEVEMGGDHLQKYFENQI